MKRLEKKLLAWEEGMERVSAETFWTAAQRGAELARRMAPVDSGELRGGIRAIREDGGAAVVSTGPHAAMVEYGTVKSAAQPYMLPMAQEMRAEFAELARTAAKEVLV